VLRSYVVSADVFVAKKILKINTKTKRAHNLRGALHRQATSFKRGQGQYRETVNKGHK